MCRSRRHPSLQKGVWTDTSITLVVLSEHPLLQNLPADPGNPQEGTQRAKQTDRTEKVTRYHCTTPAHCLTTSYHVLLGEVCQCEHALFKARNIPFVPSAKLKTVLHRQGRVKSVAMRRAGAALQRPGLPAAGWSGHTQTQNVKSAGCSTVQTDSNGSSGLC